MYSENLKLQLNTNLHFDKAEVYLHPEIYEVSENSEKQILNDFWNEISFELFESFGFEFKF